jgi:rod shape-determining protein MreC
MSTSRDDFGIAIRSALLQRGAKQKFSLFVLILLSLSIFALDISELKPIKY